MLSKQLELLYIYIYITSRHTCTRPKKENTTILKKIEPGTDGPVAQVAP